MPPTNPPSAYRQALASLESAISTAIRYGVEPPTRYHRIAEARTFPDYADDFVEHLQRWEARKSQECVSAVHANGMKTAKHEAVVAMQLRSAVTEAEKHAKALRNLQARLAATRFPPRGRKTS